MSSKCLQETRVIEKKKMKNASPVFFDFDKHAPMLIPPTVYAALCILLSLALTVVSHHYPAYEYSLLTVCITLVLLEIGFFTRRAVHYIPMLWIWCIWLMLRITNTNYLECVEEVECTAISNDFSHRAAGTVQFAAALLTLIRPFRGPVLLFILALLVGVSHLLPNPELTDERTSVLRVVCFVVMYYASLIVHGIASVTEKPSNSGVVKILQSQWCLFVLNPWILLVTSAVQIMAVMLFIGAHSGNLDHVNYDAEDGLLAHTANVENQKKHSSSDV